MKTIFLAFIALLPAIALANNDIIAGSSGEYVLYDHSPSASCNATAQVSVIFKHEKVASIEIKDTDPDPTDLGWATKTIELGE